MNADYKSLDNKALMQRWFDEVWNKGRAEAIDELFAADGLAHGLSDAEPLRGPDGFRPFFHTFKNAFPDVEIVVADLIAEGDKVAARCIVRAKHQGDTLGFAATQRSVEFNGICITRWRDAQIVEAWNNFDFMAMHQQLGVTPPQFNASNK